MEDRLVYKSEIFQGERRLKNSNFLCNKSKTNSVYLHDYLSHWLLFTCSAVSDSLWPHGLQHTSLPCRSPSHGACSKSCPLSQWLNDHGHPTISSSVIPFSSCLLSFLASGSMIFSFTFFSSYIIVCRNWYVWSMCALWLNHLFLWKISLPMWMIYHVLVHLSIQAWSAKGLHSLMLCVQDIALNTTSFNPHNNPCSVQFSHSVMSDSLWPHEPQHDRPPWPSPTSGVHPNPCPSSRWYHPTISSSVIPFSSCPQSFPASGSFPMSQFFASGSQSIGVSASISVLPMNTQDWSPLGWTGWISLQSKGLSRVFSNTTVQKHQFFGTQLSL